MIKFKRVSSLIIAIIMLTTIFTFAGCSVEKEDDSNNDKANETENDTGKSSDKVVIGLSLPTQKEERWVRDKDIMVSEAESLGVELKVQVSDNDTAKQVTQCENLISQGIDVLILAPNEAESFTSVVEKAKAEGIKVISYDRLLLKTDVDLYISFDNAKVGELQGKYLTEKVPTGKYVVLSGDPGDNNAKLFREGAMSVIQPLVDKGDIEIVLDQACKGWDPKEAQSHMENALTKSNNDIQGVLAPNDGTAGGCIQALAAQGLDGKVPITGQDAEKSAAQRIVEGTQTMTIFKDTRELGKKSIEIAIKMAKGESIEENNKINNEKIDVPSFLLDPIAVDGENIKEILVTSGYLKEEDVYKN